MSTRSVGATLLVGNPRPGSRTIGVAHRATWALTAALATQGVTVHPPSIVDLAVLGGSLPGRLSVGGPAVAEVQRALLAISRPGLLVVASPTFKGSYSGLLKLFLDLLPREGLPVGTVAVPVMTAGWPQHAFVADAYLRPLLVELGATVPVRPLTVLETEFADLDPVVVPWATASAPVLAAVLRQVASASDPTTRPAEQPVLPVPARR